MKTIVLNPDDSTYLSENHLPRKQILQLPGVYEVKSIEHRRSIEAFISARFSEIHGAKITQFLPNLLALLDRAGQPVAAMGYQNAQEGKLFLEQYLDQSIEQALDVNESKTISRSSILEVGNLASICPGSTRRLIVSLASHFYAQGFRWLVITITPEVYQSFHRLGIDRHLLKLDDARPERLTSGSDDWGKYYDSEPEVFALNFDAALETMRDRKLLAKQLNQGLVPVCDTALKENIPFGKKR